MILMAVQANVCNLSRKSFFSTEPTEGIQAVAEVNVYDWFAEFDRTLDESTAVARRSVADGNAPP